MTDETILSYLGEEAIPYDGSVGRRGYFCTVADFSAAEALEKRLTEEGFSVCTERTTFGQLIRLWRRERESVFIARQSGIGALRVVVSDGEDLFFGTDGKAKRRPGMLLMDSAYYNPDDPHNNGMGMVATLADGRFLVYDGGYPSETDGLMDYLDAQTPKGEKPVIAAWVLTHSHGDHYLCLAEFLKRCPERATVERFLFSAPPRFNPRGKEWDDHFLSERLPEIAAERGIPCFSPYEGQILSFPGVRMEILGSVDTLYPIVSVDSNQASMTTRLVFELPEAEKSVLIPGDLMGAALFRMVYLYGNGLKSDVLQLPHHGISGGVKAFCDAVDPEILLCCTAEEYCRERISTNIYTRHCDSWGNTWNHYMLHWLHAKKAIAADGGYQTIV